MSATSVLKRIKMSEFNYFPVIVDYNFAESRPRGGSACFDFFVSGRLCALMDDVTDDGLVLVAKEDIMPETGFFLLDFAKAKDNSHRVLDAVKKLNIPHVYVENSAKYPLNAIFDNETGIAVSYVTFRA